MTTARFGIILLPGSLTECGDLCREVEANGLDWLGVADSQSVFRELYVALTLAALNTGSILLGPVVTNPQTRCGIGSGRGRCLSPVRYVTWMGPKAAAVAAEGPSAELLQSAEIKRIFLGDLAL